MSDEGQAFRDWMAQWPKHSERDRLKMFSAFKAGIAAARGVPLREKNGRGLTKHAPTPRNTLSSTTQRRNDESKREG